MIGEKQASRQLPLDLRHAQGLSRDDLVVTDANSAAVALVDRWPQWPSSLVVLVGPAGSGKSHLASIWRHMSDALRISPGAIGENEIAIAESRPILIDGADGDALDERGLFHLVNAVRAAGGGLLLTARRPVAGWGVRLPDLLSRLKAAATVEIAPPDDALLAAVITKLFADRQVEVEPHVVQFLVRRIERSLVTAIAVVERLDRAALERKSRITRTLASEILETGETGQGGFDFSDTGN